MIRTIQSPNISSIKQALVFIQSLLLYKMSIYVITGASRGIGLEFVRQVSSKGNTVFACARNPDQSEELRQLTDNKSVYSVRLDVTCDRSLKVNVPFLLISFCSFNIFRKLFKKFPSMPQKASMS